MMRFALSMVDPLDWVMFNELSRAIDGFVTIFDGHTEMHLSSDARWLIFDIRFEWPDQRSPATVGLPAEQDTPRPQPLICPECGQEGFIDEGGLNQHRTKVHNPYPEPAGDVRWEQEVPPDLGEHSPYARRGEITKWLQGRRLTASTASEIFKIPRSQALSDLNMLVQFQLAEKMSTGSYQLCDIERDDVVKRLRLMGFSSEASEEIAW